MKIKFNCDEEIITCDEKVLEELKGIERDGYYGLFGLPTHGVKFINPDFMFKYPNDNNVKEYIYIETE